MAIDYDLLNPPAHVQAKQHKLKRLVPTPNSFFMDVRCTGCFQITTVFSHATSPVTCDGCQNIIATPTGGKAALAEGCSYRMKE